MQMWDPWKWSLLGESASGDIWTIVLQGFLGLADYWQHQESFSFLFFFNYFFLNFPTVKRVFLMTVPKSQQSAWIRISGDRAYESAVLWHSLGNSVQLLKCDWWSSHHGAVEMNPTRKHEVAGSIPGLHQWVKDLALPYAVVYVGCRCGSDLACGIGRQL